MSGCAGMNAAEELADLYRMAICRQVTIVECDNGLHDLFISRFKLAIDFGSMGPGFVFRAIMDDWDLLRITREIY